MDAIDAEFISALIVTCEAGGVSAVVGGIIYMLIRLIKRNGCTCRVNTCKGEELMVMDCEEGAPAPRHRPPPDPAVDVNVEGSRT